jgi:hypothetical protein
VYSRVPCVHDETNVSSRRRSGSTSVTWDQTVIRTPGAIGTTSLQRVPTTVGPGWIFSSSGTADDGEWSP